MDKSKIYINKKDEWYTPKNIVDMFSKFSKFDLDPATTKENAKRLGIKNYYTKETNGLDKEWKGKVWLNPPFSNKSLWIKKARDYADAGGEIFMLLPLAPETLIWGKYILGKADIYIPNKRINFLNENFKYQNGTAFTSVIVKLTKYKSNNYYTFNIKEGK